jgi:biotin carboxylase/MFS family permease
VSTTAPPACTRGPDALTRAATPPGPGDRLEGYDGRVHRGGAYREVLEVREARALIGASAASQIGDWLYNAALLSYVYIATGSAWWVGAATIFRLLPYVLLGPVGGMIADRYRRRTVLIVGDLLRLASMLALGVVVALKGPVELVIALTALASAAGTAERPAAIALLPRLVGEMRLGAANALLHTVQDLGVVVGPAIGAILLAVGPEWLAFVANAVTFAISATLVATIRDRSRAGGARDGASRVANRIRVTSKTRLLLPLVAVAGMVELIYGAQTVQLVLYARGPLGLGAGGYGVLLAASGAGGVLSAVVNARLTMGRRIAFAIVASAVLTCATQFVFAASDQVVLAIVAAAAGGAGLVACEVVAETVLTRIAPADMIGRLIGVFDSALIASMIVGALLAPLLVEATSLRASFVILGVAAIGVILLGRLGLRWLDAANARLVDELAERIAVLEGMPVTQGLPRMTTERIASSSQFVEVPAGVDVVVQGAPAHALYGIVDGTVMVRRNGADVVALAAGAVFGERGLLDNAPRNASVTTTSPARLLRIDGEALIEALQATPALRMALDRDAGAGAPLPASGASESSRDPERAVDPAGATVVVVSGGYPSKRRLYERLHALGARLVIVDEVGHWSQALVEEGIADRWLAAPVTGDAASDADAVLAALRDAGVRADGVLTFWEDSAPVVARVARALGLPGNPMEAVDAARSKLRTRELSARLGLPTPRAVRVRSLDELYAAAADLGFPAVVKPEFGAAQVGCVRVDDFATLPAIYRRVRGAASADADAIFRAGNDLMLEEYLDGVEFDVDLVMQDGECVFSSASQNWPTLEPSFQEQGLHCPPDHNRRATRGVIAFSVEAAQAFGLHTGVLHIEAKATNRGPRIVEINARMGGGRIYEMVRAVWDVDLVEAQLRASLGMPQQLQPSRRARCAVVNKLLYAPSSGRLQALSLSDAPVGGFAEIDVEAEVGELVSGPEAIFATCLAEITISGRDLGDARALVAEVLREQPVVESADVQPVAPAS